MNRAIATGVTTTLPTLLLAAAMLSCAPRRTVRGSADAPMVMDKGDFLNISRRRMNTVRGEAGDTLRFASDAIFPGDNLKIVLYEKLPASMETRNEMKRVGTDGMIFLLPMGDIRVAGMNVPQAEKFIEKKLSAFIVSPHCEIEITKRETDQQMVYVFGEVAQTGTLPIRPRYRLLDAIADAGGCRKNAYRRSVKVIRVAGREVVMFSINLKEILDGGKMEKNILLRDQDVVYVPRSFLTNFYEVSQFLSTLLPWYFFVKNFE